MNNLDLLQKLAVLSVDEIEKALNEDSSNLPIQNLIGEEKAEQLIQTARAPKARGIKEPIAVLPGIMGSLLFSIRGVTTMLWINPLLFINGQASYLRIDDEERTSPMVECVAFSLEKLTYLKLVLELRREFTVYEFPYDWRLPIENNADILHSSIERWISAHPGQKITLVAHSMGGLVSRSYLGRHPETAENRISRLITLGTPHLGATSAIDNLYHGNQMIAVVDRINQQNEMNQVVLSMPSVYQLLPAPPSLLPGNVEPANWNLYDASTWGITGIKQKYLDLARSFHESLAASDPQVELVQIAGCNIQTLTLIKRENGTGTIPYEMIAFDEGKDSGDGTVPGWSGFYPKARVYYIQEVHRNLPGNSDVIQAVKAITREGKCNLSQQVPKKKSGLIARDSPLPVNTRAAIIEEKIHSGTVTEADLENLYFAL
ncbi:lecithin:cholesterol acyltransferase [Anaerolinea thermolimosa]|uniref:esterase/lipase family protein n=1 Tax=Anaerolinea thermolimosa TaxID=229919 RepID=UPI0007804C76|nr:alpha/beta fold hydrolase [Anaerolinea thermolimosa]GAP06633.1 lecithin:cholesterol acyltransferase [Anaerolinea thermolimosa]